MSRLTLLLLSIILLLGLIGCTRRMAPFAPHRTDTDFHRTALASSDCLGCHEIRQLSRAHSPEDNCLKCHRIVQGD